MVKTENFIYFLTVCGFFIGLIFSVLTHTNPIYIVWITIAVTMFFYIVSLASSGYFIKHSHTKKTYELKTEVYDIELNKAISQIRKRERFLRDSQRYIRELERELYKEQESIHLSQDQKTQDDLEEVDI